MHASPETIEVSAPSENLRRDVRLIDLVTLGAGTAIGATIFSVLGPAAQVGHEGLLIAVALAALPMVVFALVYAYMGSAVPHTAASFEWQREFTSPVVAFAIVWLRVLSNAVVMIVLGQVLASYLGGLVPLPPKVTMIGFFTLIFLLNYRGVALAARVQTVLMSLLLAALSVLVLTGAPHWQPHLFVVALSKGWAPIVLTLPLMIQLFTGIETATEVGGEVEDAKRVVPWGVALSLLLTLIVYLLVAFSAMSLLGADGLAASDTPLLAAARVVLGRWADPFIVSAATLSLVKSMNAVFLVYSRFIYAMGRSGSAPSVLGRVHPKFGTPHVATVVAYLATLAGLMLPTSLIFLLLAVNLPTMMKYLGTCLAAYNVAAHRPDVQAAAFLKFSPTTVKVLSVLGIIAAFGIGFIGISTDWRPYVLLLGWLIVGLTYYFFSVRLQAEGVR